MGGGTGWEDGVGGGGEEEASRLSLRAFETCLK